MSSALLLLAWKVPRETTTVGVRCTVSGQAAVVSVQMERTGGCRVASATVSSPLLQLLVFAARDCSLCAIQQKRIAIVLVAVKSWVSIYWKLLSFDQNQRHWRLGGVLSLAFLRRPLVRAESAEKLKGRWLQQLCSCFIAYSQCW